MTRLLSGTLVSIETTTPPKVMVRAEGQFQTLPVAKGAAVERESSFVGGAEAKTERIGLSDLTPGEYVVLGIDGSGRVKHVRAVVCVERAKVRSASGASVVLEDGTTLTIGSVLRFVTAEGKPSAMATVRPGETILLFRHPQTRNIYRISAEPPSGHGSARSGTTGDAPTSQPH
jgi:hypothetical protein